MYTAATLPAKNIIYTYILEYLLHIRIKCTQYIYTHTHMRIQIYLLYSDMYTVITVLYVGRGIVARSLSCFLPHAVSSVCSCRQCFEVSLTLKYTYRLLETRGNNGVFSERLHRETTWEFSYVYHDNNITSARYMHCVPLQPMFYDFKLNTVQQYPRTSCDTYTYEKKVRNSQMISEDAQTIYITA